MRTAMVWVAVCGSAAALAAAWYVERPPRIGDAQLAGTFVGAPYDPKNKCCKKAVREDCAPVCVTNPYCPANAFFDDKCVGAFCDTVTDPNSICNPPAQLVTLGNRFRCTLSGQKVDCTDPPNTERCQYTPFQQQITYTTCNFGESLCATQPAGACP